MKQNLFRNKAFSLSRTTGTKKLAKSLRGTPMRKLPPEGSITVEITSTAPTLNQN